MYLTSSSVTYYVRRYVLPALGIPLASIVEIAEIRDHSFVNWVFRVRIANDLQPLNVYVKQIRGYTKARPEVSMDPTRAAVEAKILRMLSRIVLGVTPTVLWHDEANHILVLDDIGRGAPLLVDELAAGRVHGDCITYFGNILAKIHCGTRLISPTQVRGSDAANVVAMRTSQNLRLEASRMLYPREVDRLLALSEATEPGLVLGDLGPKNIYVDQGAVRFLDFERAFVGDQTFDLGFLLSHYLVEVPPAARASGVAAIQKFISVYRAACSDLGKDLDAAFDRRLLGWLGVMVMYRVSNSYMGRQIACDIDFWRSRALFFLRADDTDAIVALERTVPD